MSFANRRSTATGFTLVELLLVIAIIAALVSLLLPAVQAARGAARNAHSKNNLRQLGIAAIAADGAHDRTPAMFGSYPAGSASGVEGSLFYHLLPYIEEQALYDAGPDASRSRRVTVLAHPSDVTYGSGTYELTTSIPPWAGKSQTWGVSSYAANWQIFGDRGVHLSVAVKDGTSNTLMFTEKYAITSRPSGNPSVGASLWGYGITPDTDDFRGNYWVESLLPNTLPPSHLYVSGYWPRVGFVNWNGPVAWEEGDTWRCRCHKRPEFNPDPKNAHPLKAQSMAAVINICLADGSVTSLSDDITDELWYYWTTPADWVLSTGGSVVVNVDGQSQSIEQEGELPDQPFKLNAVAWDIYPGDRNSQVTDAELQRLTQLTDLRQLDLWAADVTDAGVRSLSAIGSLERLQLSGTRITDASFESLDKLANLRELGLIDVNVSPAAIKRFSQRHPKCNVIRSKKVVR